MFPRKLDADEACHILTPHKERIWRTGTIPFLRWQEYPNQSVHSFRTRATAMNDLMVFQARTEFADVKGARFVELGHPATRTLLEIDRRIILRFKMLDERGYPKNYRTNFIKEYELNHELPGIPPRPHRMTLGYILNPLQTAISRVLVTSSVGNRIEYELLFHIPTGRISSITSGEQVGDRDDQSRGVEIRVIKQRAINE